MNAAPNGGKRISQNEFTEKAWQVCFCLCTGCCTRKYSGIKDLGLLPD